MNTYTDKQYQLIELLLTASTCPDAEAPLAIQAAEDLAITMPVNDVLIAQNAMLRIIRRTGDD
jgi:hypothetical protein